jgi:hypothetical protein
MRRFSLEGLLAGGNDFLALRLATLDALLDMHRILTPRRSARIWVLIMNFMVPCNSGSEALRTTVLSVSAAKSSKFICYSFPYDASPLTRVEVDRVPGIRGSSIIMPRAVPA